MNRQKSNRREFLKTSALTFAVAGASNPIADALFAQDASETATSVTPAFKAAVPVWAEGREEEMNVTLVFTAEATLESAEDAQGAILRSGPSATCFTATTTSTSIS